MAQQTAVEWLQNQLTLALGDGLKSLRGLFVVAKEMEREQIINAHNNGKFVLPPNDDGKEYYKETYQTQAQ